MKERTVEIEDQQVTASAWESHVESNPVVFLHGFPMDRHLWDAVGDRLAATHSVYAIDLPGFGGSTSDATVLGMPESADWLVSALRAFGIDSPVILAGLSMGGYIAMEFATRHPEHLKQLVLCNTKAEVDSDEVRKVRIEMAESIDHIGVESVAENMLPKLLARSTRQSQPDVVQQLREMMRRVAPSSLAAAQRGMAARRSMVEHVPRWNCRVACITGDEDTLTGADVMRPIAESAKHGRLHIIPQAGHVAPIEAPEALSQCIRSIL